MERSTNPARDRQPSPLVYAEAAAWVARIHGPLRSRKVEESLRRWLSADARHSEAFEAMTAAWEVTGNLPKRPFPRVSRWERRGYLEGFVRSALVVAALAVVLVGAGWQFYQSRGVVTGIGEQRNLTLADGTRVLLNTDSRIVIRYDDHLRKVQLKSGEALFEVAKHIDRPFIVEAGDRQVVALGTAFVVREDSETLAVTLVEGKVAVSNLAALDVSAAQALIRDPGAAQFAPDRAGSDANAFVLSQGQRLTLSAHNRPLVDRPAIEQVTAWKRGQVDLDEVTLTDAIREMNRYSDIKLVVDDPDVGAIHVTGVFRIGDAPSFAAAVARAYEIEAIEDGNRILLRMN
jgi:transmembrane sensor